MLVFESFMLVATSDGDIDDCGGDGDDVECKESRPFPASIMPLATIVASSTEMIAGVLIDKMSMICPMAFGICIVATVDIVSAPKASNSDLDSGTRMDNILVIEGGS